MLRASVIIPHYQMPDSLRICLDSVLGQTLDHGAFEVIVVDNNSRVFPADVAAAYPMVQFLSQPQPGPGLARNTGVAAAGAPLLVFIDADCRAETGWLQAAIDAVEPDPVHSVVGGDVRIDVRDPRRLTPLEAYEAVFAYRQQLYIATNNFAGTGNLAMGAAVHAAVGPFAGIDVAEDIEWGARATAAGYRICYVDAMRIYHPARTSFAELQRKWQRHIAHAITAHRAARRSGWRWALQRLVVLASIPPHAVKMLVSDRLNGSGNRWRGIGMLVRIRLWRVAEMGRAAAAPPVSGGSYWTTS